MRLTLRTLLCYLDDVLDPADAEDLAQKIQENPQAAKLAHNIREVMRRSRLGAPRLDGKGLAVDANTVAEYLDNTLPTEKYPDFEKVCLESDMHMAEVASCHQILTLVLGGPVEVDPQVRQRMYRLGAMTDEQRQAEIQQRQLDAAETAPVPEPKSAALVAKEMAPAPRPKPEVPEYMKSKKPEVPDYMKVGRRSRFWPLVAAVVTGFGATAVALLAMGPLNQNHPLARLFGGGAEVAKAPEGKPAPELPPAAEVPSPQPEELAPPEKADPDDTAKPAPPVEPPATPVDLGQPNPEAPPVAAVPEKTPPAEPAAPVTPPAAAPEEKPVAPAPSGPAVALNNPPAAAAPAATPVAPPANEPAPPARPDENVQVARFASEDQVLARFVPERQEWLRVPARALLSAGQEFAALSTFRPQVLLATGIQITLDGDTHLLLGHPTADGVPRLVLNNGRCLLLTLGKAGAQVEVTLGEGPTARQGVLTFGDADSAAAIDVHNYFYPGSDPEIVPATPVVQIFCTSGRITFEQRGQAAAGIEAGRVLNFVGEQAPNKIAAGTLPDWIDAKNLTDLDRRASRSLFAELAAERPLGLSLKEKAEDRRAEVRSVAIRALGYLDEFEAAVAALGDESLRSYWAAQVDMLHDAIARDPRTAAKVRVALEKSRQEQAKTLYRLLWSYSPEDLARGSAAELVELLDDPNLDVRVLAYENLRRITGTTLTYRPEAPRRSLTIQRWRERLKANQIVYHTLPSPLGDLAPAAVPGKAPAEAEPPAAPAGGAAAAPAKLPLAPAAPLK